jgi:hypothetical protein
VADPAEIHGPSEAYRDFLSLARDAYSQSTSYLDSSLRRQWERNLYLWRSEHPPGSKYLSDAYKFRSKSFRPKTRSSIQRDEAKAAAAFFSTEDVVVAQAEDPSDPAQVASASLMQELLNYRLEKSIPWFMTCLGAFQSGRVYGVCISYQGWNYSEEMRSREIVNIDPATGEEIRETVDVPKVVEDRPEVRLVSPENFRFDPYADWIDPVASSPYLIELIPMYAQDVRERMNRVDQKTGQPEWFALSDGQIASSMGDNYDSIRQVREGRNREDPATAPREVTAHTLVWVRRVIVRQDGTDWLYYTLGDNYLLTTPTPLHEVYKHNERPYVVGTTILEAFRSFKSGQPELLFGLQTEANDIANSRRDNVRLALNKRYIAQRHRNVDMQALRANVPGGVVMTDDMNAVRPMEFNDVTGSSYQEQDRLNVDFDELSGSFSTSSVSSNRMLNETVGGMQMLSSDSNQLNEYTLRIFAETWVQPVLGQLVKLEQAYETDKVVMAIAGKRAKLAQKYGISEDLDSMLDSAMTVRVNVGVGATNPTNRLEKLLAAMTGLAKIKPDLMERVKDKDIASEIFGVLGYQDAERFFDWPEEGDGRQELEQQIQQLTQALESQQAAEAARQQAQVQVAQIRAGAQIQAEQMRAENAQLIARLEGAIQERIEMMKAEMAAGRADAEAERAQRQTELGARRDERLELARLGVQVRDEVGEAEEPAGPDGVGVLDRLLGTIERSNQSPELAQSMERMAQVQAESMERLTQALATMQAVQARMQEQTQQALIGGLNNVAEAMKLPRKLTRDSEGRAVGSIVTEARSV